MAEQPGFDVFGPERFGQQGIGHQIDLTDGQVVRGPPVGVQSGCFGVGEYGGSRDSDVRHVPHLLMRRLFVVRGVCSDPGCGGAVTQREGPRRTRGYMFSHVPRLAGNDSSA